MGAADQHKLQHFNITGKKKKKKSGAVKKISPDIFFLKQRLAWEYSNASTSIKVQVFEQHAKNKPFDPSGRPCGARYVLYFQK